MRYQDENDDIFEGDTSADVVRSMARSKLTKANSLRRYMRATARRIEDMTGLTIEHGSCNLFLKSLVENNLLRKIDG